MSLWDWIKYQASSYNAGSATNRLRKRRMACLERFFADTFGPDLEAGRTIRILDIGGTFRFWKSMGFPFAGKAEITLLNLDKAAIPEAVPGLFSVEGDARDMTGVEDGAFDLVVSNSCIEHVGKEPEWQMMADEMRRVGRHYFLQTPNRHFPVEPHFLFPFFQFFPVWLRAAFIRCFELGFWPKGNDWKESLRIADEIKLLRHKDLKRLFPEAVIEREKLFGLTKSFMVYR